MADVKRSNLFPDGIKKKFNKWMGSNDDTAIENLADSLQSIVNPAMAPDGVTFQLPDSLKDLPKTHPFVNKYNHQKLLYHVMQRMQMSRELRDSLIQRFRNTDHDVNGFVKLSEEDRIRMRDNRKGHGGQKPVDVNLPFVDTKLDEMNTFLADLFFPGNNMYINKATMAKQKSGLAMTKALNRQAKMKKHYSKLMRFFAEGLKYNIGAFVVEWTVEKGYVLQRDATGRRVKSQTDDNITFEGNDIINMDMYNFFWDVTTPPNMLAEKGEYFAYCELISKHETRKRATQEKIYGIERFINSGGGQLGTSTMYYQAHPIVRYDYNANYGTVVDWLKFGATGKYGSIGYGHELITMYIWINPSQFGISKDNAFQIYRIRVMDHLYLCEIEHMDALHNMLPVCLTIPFDDNIDMQHKSAAELLVDHNRTASFMMNVYTQSMRRKLFGLTVYDPSVVDLSAVGTEVAGRIAVQPTGWGKPLKDAIQHYNDAPETEGMIDDVGKIYGQMNQILPTNITNQVADLERATEYQAAATVQGGNKRQFKLARVEDDQALLPMRRMMCSNIQQYMVNPISIDDPDGNKDPQTGQIAQIQVQPETLVDMDLDDYIGNGIQGMDRLVLISHLHDIANTVVQNQAASQEIDIVDLLNYITTLEGDDFDLNQFRRTAPPPQQQEENVNTAANTVANLAGAHAAVGQAAAQAQQPGAMPGTGTG